MTCGIYFIINILDRKRYIGYSKCIEKRYNSKYDKCKQDWTKHHNKHLQLAAKKYNTENFRFVIVEECPESELQTREVFYDEMFPAHMKYNSIPCGGKPVDWNEWRIRHPEWMPKPKLKQLKQVYIPWVVRKKLRSQISDEEARDICLSWEERGMTMDELSKKFKKSRHSIHKLLLFNCT